MQSDKNEMLEYIELLEQKQAFKVNIKPEYMSKLSLVKEADDECDY